MTEANISWKEIAAHFRDLTTHFGTQVQELMQQNQELNQRVQELSVLRVREQTPADHLRPSDLCEVCGDPWNVADHAMCIGAMNADKPSWDLTKDSEERKWDHGLEVYNRMKERDPEEDTPVVYSFGPDDKDFEETTYGALKERYGELDVRHL